MGIGRLHIAHRENARIPVWRSRLAVLLLLVCSALPYGRAAPPPGALLDTGRAIYDFYCYQCHGYSGDAQTLASTYLEPPPRNFTHSDPSELTRDEMLDAVAHGRAGTGMVSFARVLNDAQIEAVVDFIREAFMTAKPRQQPYHSVENGWPDHGRYHAAFPFATGRIPLDTPWEQLTPAQIEGKRLFLNACVSCHDRARVREAGPIWETRAVSYPRRHYSHREPNVDAVTGATPYVLHERAPVANGSDPAVVRGEAVFQSNCAFCHAADGTGRNWIGSFLEPRPRDLSSAHVAGMSADQLRHIIRDGLPGTSMPAWRHVLDEQQIADVVAYVQSTLLNESTSPFLIQPEPGARVHRPPPTWTRQTP